MHENCGDAFVVASGEIVLMMFFGGDWSYDEIATFLAGSFNCDLFVFGLNDVSFQVCCVTKRVLEMKSVVKFSRDCNLQPHERNSIVDFFFSQTPW